MKYRVLLHAMTFFRDFGTLYVLSKLLERMGCDCFIVSNKNYLSRLMKIWNPHAIVYVTAGRSRLLMNHYPKAKLFFLAGEGAQDYDNCDEVIIVKDKECFSNIDKIFIWGENTLDNIKKYIFGDGKWNYGDGALESINEKIELAGHPRLDLVRFRMRSNKKKGKIKIGFIGNSHSINLMKKDTHPITRLLNGHISLHTIRYSFNLLQLYLDIMDELGDERFSFNLRPYPSETRDVYNNAGVVKVGKLKIDNNLDFSSFVMENDIIIGDLTEAFAPIVAAGKLYLGVVNLLPNYSDEHVTPVITAAKHLLNDYFPKSIDELGAMCARYQEHLNYSEELKDHMRHLFNTNSPHSVLAQVAGSIVRIMSKEQQNIGPSVPSWLLEPINVLFDTISDLRNRSVGSYSDIDRNLVRMRASIEFDPVVDGILADSKSRAFLHS